METKEIQSEWTMPVITRHKGIEYQFSPEQIKEVPKDFPMEKVRHFKVVKEGTMKKEKEERKEDNGYRQELINLSEIGEKTADDIISVYSTKDKLVKAIKKGDNLPWDTDIDRILKQHFKGGKK